ncbi:MAG: fumarylacetoacetate hydrolase family protein [Firmicutes bacterium]|nr:fumarylacetoacetate hydrolase family protein [Bacillota bacterium]
MDIQKAADRLSEVRVTGKPAARLAECGEASVRDAYEIQFRNLARRLEAGGGNVVQSGFKIGLTNAPAQEANGLTEPAFGYMLSDTYVADGAKIHAADFFAPKVEGELAFILAEPLAGPGVTIADVYAATEFVVPAIELVDSRYEGGAAGGIELIADNVCGAGFVLGSGMTPIEDVDMALTGMMMKKNGSIIGTGTTAEVLGNPAYSVAWFANALAAYGKEVPAGSVILTGAVTGAVPVKAGDAIEVSFYGMGTVSVIFD